MVGSKTMSAEQFAGWSWPTKKQFLLTRHVHKVFRLQICGNVTSIEHAFIDQV